MRTGAVHVREAENAAHFKGNLPTKRYGFCTVERTIRGVVKTGTSYTATILTPTGALRVESVNGKDWTITPHQ